MHVVHFPAADAADGAVHGLLQSAAVLSTSEALETAADDTHPLRYRARHVAGLLAKEGWTLAVYLPGSWSFSRRSTDAATLIHQQRGLEVLEGWAEVPSLSLVLLTAPIPPMGTPSFLVSLPRAARLQLPSGRASREVLEDACAWSSYAEAAERLFKAVPSPRELDVTPLQLRLLVALVRLGEPPDALFQELARSRSVHARADLEPLSGHLKRALERPENQQLRDGLRRFLQARFPLPVDMVRHISAIPEEHLPLLTHCIGSGEQEVYVDERLRRMLLRFTGGAGPRPEAEPGTHLELARFHQQRDGAMGVGQLSGPQVLHWMERVHHLGHSGALGAAEWSSLQLPVRELYWDRARALSIEQRDFLGAAAVYRQCLERVDSEDTYSWHYLAFNLDRAGQEREVAEQGFRRAVELEPSNPWWNSRLVTFLIEQSRFREAEQEWREAQERLDPDGSLVRSSRSLVLSVHRWVVKAWLDRDEVERARKVFDAIPRSVVDSYPQLQELRQRLEDAEEVRLLGESVYPASTPMEERWGGPRFLEPTNEAGSPLVEWFPGRIVRVDSEGVRVVVATPEAPAEKRRVIVRELSMAEWRECAGTQELPEAGTFMEVGTYEDDTCRIVCIPSSAPSRRRLHLATARNLRYLRRWTR
jgi:tetratricopeptide (TPR) repeat protein